MKYLSAGRHLCDKPGMEIMETSLETLHRALTSLLTQGMSLLQFLTDDQYRAPHPGAGAASVGGHYRHTLDHFFPLLPPKPDQILDYDLRGRSLELKTSRTAALTATQKLLTEAEQLDSGSLDQPVCVRCSVSQDAVSPVVQSSLAREVMYAEIHAVHHFAIIRILCNLMEVQLPEGFGVAPSTLNHLQTVQH